MKKISTILVLMLIALMLFVGCDNNTPKKDTSTENGSNNTQTEETPKERDAKAEDCTLFLNLFTVLNDDLPWRSEENMPEGFTTSADGYTLTFSSCEFDSYAIDGSDLHLKLNGSVKIEEKGEGGATKTFYSCNFTEGTSINGKEYITMADFSVDSNGINITSVSINNQKLKGVNELVGSKMIRTATPEDALIAKKLLAAFNYLETGSNAAPLTGAGTLVVNETNATESTPRTVKYIFKNCTFTDSETKYVFNGTANEKYYSTSVSFDCELSYGTKIDNINHSIRAKVEIDKSSMPATYNIQYAVIDYSMIVGLNELLASGSAE